MPRPAGAWAPRWAAGRARLREAAGPGRQTAAVGRGRGRPGRPVPRGPRPRGSGAAAPRSRWSGRREQAWWRGPRAGAARVGRRRPRRSLGGRGRGRCRGWGGTGRCFGGGSGGGGRFRSGLGLGGRLSGLLGRGLLGRHRGGRRLLGRLLLDGLRLGLADETLPLGLAADAVGLRLHDARGVALDADPQAVAEVDCLFVAEAQLRASSYTLILPAKSLRFALRRRQWICRGCLVCAGREGVWIASRVTCVAVRDTGPGPTGSEPRSIILARSVLRYEPTWLRSVPGHELRS